MLYRCFFSVNACCVTSLMNTNISSHLLTVLANRLYNPANFMQNTLYKIQNKIMYLS
jgi:hypothetical protein